jgi:hypothetical protein
MSWLQSHNPDFMPIIEATIEGVRYDIAYNSRTNTVVIVITEDENFKTADCLRVGSCVPLTKKQLGSSRGGLTRGPVTSDGWITIVGYRSHVTTCQQETDGSPVIIDKDKVPSKDGILEAKIIKFMR